MQRWEHTQYDSLKHTFVKVPPPVELYLYNTQGKPIQTEDGFATITVTLSHQNQFTTQAAAFDNPMMTRELRRRRQQQQQRAIHLTDTNANIADLQERVSKIEGTLADVASDVNKLVKALT